MRGAAPPRSQYDRNLTFRVVGGGPVASLTMPIKPQEFQSDHPARVTTTQTLQGVYQDFGGLGVRTLTYQGHTGWRRRVQYQTMDGFDVFMSLYNNIYVEYHRRKEANTSDPSAVYALVIDDLYDTVYRVSLDDFQASKSRSNPLLYYYTLRMTVITTSVDTREAEDLLGLPSVQVNASQISNRVSYVQNIVSQYTQPSNRSYMVQSGDSLWSIAVQFYGDGNQFRKIAQANSIQPPYTIYPGQVLTIP
jgi:nucleoid-associated protein YgaU